MKAIHALRRGFALLGLCVLVALPVATRSAAAGGEQPCGDPRKSDDPTLANVLVNSVIRALTEAYGDPIIWDGSKLTDEHVSGINWPETKDLGKRVLPYDAGPANTMYGALQRFRFMADSVATRLETLLEKPNEDRRMALVLA